MLENTKFTLLLLVAGITFASCDYTTAPPDDNEPPPADVGVRVRIFPPSGDYNDGPFGIFLIDESGAVRWSFKRKKGAIGFQHCGHVPSGSYYLAVLISQNQTHPINFVAMW